MCLQANNLVFLTEEQVLEIHQECISSFGGMNGVRDRNLFLSALNQPKQTIGGEYLYGSIYKMAVAYLFFFAKNHAFLDGNKRVALKTCYIFLGLNCAALIMDNNEAEDLVLGCVEDRYDIEKLTEIIMENTAYYYA